MKDFEPKGQILERAGFVRVGMSNLFLQGLFAVEQHPDGSSSLMVDYESNTKWLDVVAIKNDTEKGYFSLMALTAEGRFINSSLNRSGTFGGEAPVELKVFGGTLERQLVAAGFVRDEKEPRIFRNIVKDEDEKVEILAIMEGGRIKSVLKPLRESAARLLGINFQITGGRSSIDDFGKAIYIIDVENDKMHFQISSKIDGVIVDGSQKLLRSITEEELDIKEFPISQEVSGFKIGGVNSTEQIRKLREINGQSISKLEKKMRPHSMSMAGFLGDDESLIKILAEDNDVVMSNGLTHQDLAKPLIYAREHELKGLGENFTYKNRHFHVRRMGWRGMQESPFNDETATSIDITITNLDTGAELSCSGLLPDMIQRYGFYEGKRSNYRLDPNDIIVVFDFLKKSS